MERCERCGGEVELVASTKGRLFPLDFIPRPKGAFYLSAGREPVAIRVELKARYLSRYIVHDDERFDSHLLRCPETARTPRRRRF